MKWLCKIVWVLILINLTVFQLTNGQRISLVEKKITEIKCILATHGAFCGVVPVREPPAINEKRKPTAILQIILKTIVCSGA